MASQHLLRPVKAVKCVHVRPAPGSATKTTLSRRWPDGFAEGGVRQYNGVVFFRLDPVCGVDNEYRGGRARTLVSPPARWCTRRDDRAENDHFVY
jgi:hypothetical protein